jgi:hypothetical protein
MVGVVIMKSGTTPSALIAYGYSQMLDSPIRKYLANLVPPSSDCSICVSIRYPLSLSSEIRAANLVHPNLCIASHDVIPPLAYLRYPSILSQWLDMMISLIVKAKIETPVGFAMSPLAVCKCSASPIIPR